MTENSVLILRQRNLEANFALNQAGCKFKDMERNTDKFKEGDVVKVDDKPIHYVVLHDDGILVSITDMNTKTTILKSRLKLAEDQEN